MFLSTHARGKHPRITDAVFAAMDILVASETEASAPNSKKIGDLEAALGTDRHQIFSALGGEDMFWRIYYAFHVFSAL